MIVEEPKEELVESDPQQRVDLATAMFSELTDELIATMYVDDKPRHHWRDKALEADYNLLRIKLPDRVLGFPSRTRDERLWLINARSDIEPGEVYLFDRQTKGLRLQYRLREKLPRAHLARMTVIRCKSSDGLEIPAYLTLPKGSEVKNLPVVVVPHS